MADDRARSLALLRVGWTASVSVAVGVRFWNALFGPLFYGYDAWGHVAYVFFLDLYHALPYADQGWSYFHPPLHYLFGWALTTAGDPVVLITGLSALGSLASLGIAALAARVVRRAFPERRGLPLLAFTAIAFLPVHLYTSPMPGNEMTAAFVGAAAVWAYLRNALRERPTLAGDVATGALCGLAMLSKFTDVVPCLALGGALALGWLRSGAVRAGAARFAARASAIVVPLLVIAGPWYARNVAEFGTPFMTSADVKDVARVQAEQPPGERGLADFFAISPKLFEDSTGDAPHMLHSVWSNTYLNVWFDTYREGQLPLPGFPIRHPLVHQLTIFFGVLGLVPTLVALVGALSSVRRAWRDGRAEIDATMLLLAAGTLAAFVLFALRIPTWAALKASYLLNLSLPFAYFLARGTRVLARRDPWLGAAAPIAVGAIALCATPVFTTGGLLRRHFDSHQMVSVDAHFGRFESTRDLFRQDAPQRSYLEARAAAELLDGHPGLARRFYVHATRLPLVDPTEEPYWKNRLAVATALARDVDAAEALLSEVLDEQPIAEVLVNRGALRAFDGDLAGAEADLRAAIAVDPTLPPAWTDLAVVLALSGAADDAEAARARAAREEATPPRGFPYGVGTGYLYDSGAGQRFMLVLDLADARPGEPAQLALGLYYPARARNVSPRSPRLLTDVRVPAAREGSG